MKADELYAKVTNEIIAAIEAGAGEWKMPWRRLGAMERSIAGRPYNGINLLILGITADQRGYASHQWGTYKAWAEAGGQVRRGERGTHVFLWKRAQPRKAKTPDEEPGKPYLLARTFTVFAREQVDGLPPLAPAVELTMHERIEAAEEYFAAIGAHVVVGGDQAFYAPVQDYIAVPRLEQFDRAEHYYTTLAHEHGHWSGHKDRLNRDLTGRFGSEAYAAEELVAELTAAFWGARNGMDPAVRQDHSSYLSHWLSILRQDCKAIVTAASKAQAAVDYLDKLAGAADRDPAAPALIGV